VPTANGGKNIKYRTKCINCNVDKGYSRQVDALRHCLQCENKKRTSATEAHRKIKASMKANITARLRTRLLSKNRKSTFDLVDYTVDDLKIHLESLFEPGMSWDNYGINGWEIDHRKPDSWFSYDSTDHTEFAASWALSNLQPKWAKLNRSKGNKYED